MSIRHRAYWSHLAARSASGDRALIYLSDGGSVSLDFDAQSAMWIDPYTGTRLEADPTAPIFTTPPIFPTDSVLLVTHQNLGA